MKTIQPGDDHLAFRQDILDVLAKHGATISQEEMLALTSYTVGQIIAVMDQRKWTVDLCMRVVMKNIQAGNKQVVDGLVNKTPKGRMQ